MQRAGQIRILTRETRSNTFTWREESISPFESVWGLLQKFRMVNALSDADLKEIFGADTLININRLIRSDTITDLERLGVIYGTKLSSVLQVDIVSISIQHINNMLGKLPKNKPFENRYHSYIRKELFYCEKCISAGFHSIFHQFTLVEYCPFHLTKLRSCCPNCHRSLPFLTLTGFLVPFTCKCGYPLIHNNLNDIFLKVWQMTSEIQVRDPVLSNWLSLNNDYCIKKLARLYFSRKISNSNSHNMLNHLLNVIQPKSNIDKGRYFVYSSKSIHSIKTKEQRIDERGGWTDIVATHQYALYYSTFAVYKSIARHIRNTVLKEHKKCINKMFSTTKKCPVAYAYHFWIHDTEGDGVWWGQKYKRRSLIYYNDELSIVIHRNRDLLLELYRLWRSLVSIRTVTRASTKWIMNHALGHLIYDNFKVWLKITLDNWDKIVNFERTNTKNSLKSNTYLYIVEQRDSFLDETIPLYSFVLNSNEPLEFHWSQRNEDEVKYFNRVRRICK